MVEESDVITLQDEEGLEHRFNIVDIVEVDRHKYAVLLPEDEEDAAAVIFRVERDDHLIPIEDDEELSRVMAALEETEGYGAIILEDGGEDADDLEALNDLGGESGSNGEELSAGDDDDDDDDEENDA